MNKMQPIRLVRILLMFFVIMLFLSGLTAIPVDMELSFLLNFFSADTQMYHWLDKVLTAYR
jgi:hypothetical protein